MMVIKVLNNKLLANKPETLKSNDFYNIDQSLKKQLQDTFNKIASLKGDKNEIFNNDHKNILRLNAFEPIEEYYTDKANLLGEAKNIIQAIITNFNNVITTLEPRTIEYLSLPVNEWEKADLNIRNIMEIEKRKQELQDKINDIDNQIEGLNKNLNMTRTLWNGEKSEARKDHIKAIFKRHESIAKPVSVQAKQPIQELVEPASDKKNERSVSVREKADLIKAIYAQLGFSISDAVLSLWDNALEDNASKIDQPFLLSSFIAKFNLDRIIIEIGKEVHKMDGSDNVKIKVTKENTYYLSGKDSLKFINMATTWLDAVDSLNTEHTEEIDIKHFYKIMDTVSSFFAALINKLKIEELNSDENSYPVKIDGKWVGTDNQFDNMFNSLKLLSYVDPIWRRDR